MISVADDEVDPLTNFVPTVDGVDDDPKAISTVPEVPLVVAYAGRYMRISYPFVF